MWMMTSLQLLATAVLVVLVVLTTAETVDNQRVAQWTVDHQRVTKWIVYH